MESYKHKGGAFFHSESKENSNYLPTLSTTYVLGLYHIPFSVHTYTFSLPFHTIFFYFTYLSNRKH